MEVGARQGLPRLAPPFLPSQIVRSEILSGETPQCVDAVGRRANHDAVLRRPLPSERPDQKWDRVLVSDLAEVKECVVRGADSVTDDTMAEKSLFIGRGRVPPRLIPVHLLKWPPDCGVEICSACAHHEQEQDRNPYDPFLHHSFSQRCR